MALYSAIMSQKGVAMGTRTWNKDRATKRIDAKIDALPLKDIEIKEYVRDTNLSGISNTTAYRVDGVHVYADILNLTDMLNVTDVEGETCHKQTLRFLNMHYRAVHRIIGRVDSILVDFHNQRLHSVFAKPYDDEAKRVHRAIATGQLIIDVLARTGEDANHPAAKVRIGIDTGKALAVNNGRRGHREPLFLGEPANYAAKRAGGGSVAGIYLTNKARAAVGLAEAANVDRTPLTAAEIETSQKAAKLDVTVDQIVNEWAEDLKNNPDWKLLTSRGKLCVPKIRFCNIDGEGRQGQVVADDGAEALNRAAWRGASLFRDRWVLDTL